LDSDNVDNTSDVNKPISNLTQTELNKKAPIDQPHFTGQATMDIVSINDVSINRSIQIPNAISTENSNIAASTNFVRYHVD
jgi:hypothetical protein